MRSLVPFGFGFNSDYPSFFDDFGFHGGLPDFFDMNKNFVRSDIKETDTSYIVEAELPGFKKEEIKVSMRDGVLNISAETNSEVEDKKHNYVRKERVSGKFSRNYVFDNVNEDAITAKYDNGILVVELPKSEKISTEKGITVQ